MGFKTVRQWVDASDEGKTHIVSFRKAVSAAATTMGDYIDYTYFTGSPVANFYASAPLEAALVEADKGIRVPDVPEQFVKSLTVMSVGSTATSTANQNQTLQLLDYLIYYPQFTGLDGTTLRIDGAYNAGTRTIDALNGD